MHLAAILRTDASLAALAARQIGGWYRISTNSALSGETPLLLTWLLGQRLARSLQLATLCCLVLPDPLVGQLLFFEASVD